jgi:hypothetical protein
VMPRPEGCNLNSLLDFMNFRSHMVHRKGMPGIDAHIRDLGFSHQRLWRLLSSGTWHRAVWPIVTVHISRPGRSPENAQKEFDWVHKPRCGLHEVNGLYYGLSYSVSASFPQCSCKWCPTTSCHTSPLSPCTT